MANIDTSKLVNLGNLQYYDQKIKDYTKKYTDSEIAKFDFIKVVSTLPEEGLENRIYLVPIAVSNGFPVGESGVYKYSSNFTELLYTWDEIWANGEKGEDWQSDYTMWDGAGYIMGTVGGDIILPNEPIIYPWGGGEPYWGIDLHCGNVVIPAWSADCSSGISLSDFKSDDSTYGRPNSTIDCKLETIYIKATTPPSLYMPKEYVPYLTKIVVPKGYVDIYKSATNWCDYADIIIEGEEATEDQNLFDEWIWVNKGTEESPEYVWEWITVKSLIVDLTEYATKDFVEQTLLDGKW